MPAKSERQRRYIYATKGKAWAKRHHMDNKGKLPERSGSLLHSLTKKRGY